MRLDGLDLLLVGADHVVDAGVGAGGEVVGAGAAGDQRAGAVAGGVERAADQLLRLGPAEAHAALGGVHRLGDAEAEVPEVVAEAEGARPSRWRASATGRCRRAGRRRHGRRRRRSRLKPVAVGLARAAAARRWCRARGCGRRWGGSRVAMVRRSSAGTSSQRRSRPALQAELGELHALGALDEAVGARARPRRRGGGTSPTAALKPLS